MKKYFLKISALFMFVAVLTSCDEDKVFYTNAQSLVGFNGVNANAPTYSAADNKDFTLQVEVGSTKKVDYDRTFAISINNTFTTATPNQYTLQQTNLVIPANQYVGTVAVKGNYDALPANFSEVLLSLDLVSVQDQDLVNEEKTNFTVSLYRSCVINIPLEYTGIVTSSLGSATPEFDVKFVQQEQFDNTYRSLNLWGDFLAGATGDDFYAGGYEYLGNVRIKCNNTVVVSGDYINSAGPGGTGTYDPTSKIITLKLKQKYFTDAIAEIKLTPKQ